MNSLRQLRTLLVLGRVSNLPTVWSNCLAGWWLGGGGNFWKLPFLLLGLTALYTGGAFLNDAFDAESDRQRRPERPIPAGKISAQLVWRAGFGQLVAGIFLLLFCGQLSAGAAILLALFILLYDFSHQFFTAAPWLLGACRFWIYVLAGAAGAYQRTANRRDFSVEPRGPTLLDGLSGAGVPVVTVGKVDELFAGRGVSARFHTSGNTEGIRTILAQLAAQPAGLIFANLVDFDMLYGHRNDAPGFARALEEFDAALPAILDGLRDEDLLIITADHGNDPTTPSTDHSREYVPLLCVRKAGPPGVDLGTRATFADVGQTIAEHFGVANALAGTSFLAKI